MSKKPNPFDANNWGDRAWHPHFSVTRRATEQSGFWPRCEATEDGKRCTLDMGHDFGQLRTDHNFST